MVFFYHLENTYFSAIKCKFIYNIDHMLALLSSMPFESDYLLAGLKNVRTTEIAGKIVHSGKLSGNDIIIMNTGIGKINAAHSATCLFEHYSLKKIVNIGVGGAYPGSGLNNGDIAIASKEIYGDDGVIDEKGWMSLKEIGIPLVESGGEKYFNEYPVCAVRAIRESPLHVKTGNFVTVSAVSGTQQRAKELEKRFNAICENMEGAAIAHVCAIYNIPMLEIRGISNIAGERDKRKWNMQQASENCQKFVLDFFGDM